MWCIIAPLQTHFPQGQDFLDHFCSRFHPLNSSMRFLPLSPRMGVLDTSHPGGAGLAGSLGSQISYSNQETESEEAKTLHDSSRGPRPAPHLWGSELGLALKSAHSFSTTLIHDCRDSIVHYAEEKEGRKRLGKAQCLGLYVRERGLFARCGHLVEKAVQRSPSLDSKLPEAG